MKRIICFIGILVILLGLCACHVQEENPESTDASHMTNGMIPRRILVYSKVALSKLVNAAKLPDAEFAEFVAQVCADQDSQISMASNTEKEEVESLVQFLQSGMVPMLKSGVIPEDYKFEYRPFESLVVTGYTINGVRYVFGSGLYQGDGFCYEGKTEGVLAIGDDSVTLHRDGKRPVLSYLQC